jgi:hypothetical protein
MSNQLDDVVKTLITDVQSRLDVKIEQSIVDHLRKTLDNYDYESKINLLTSLKLDSKLKQIEISPVDVEAKISAAADIIIENLSKQARIQIVGDIARKIDTIDFNQSVINAVAQQVEARLQQVVFPKDSIDFSAIKKDQIELSGNNIKGGIIDQFASTGIDDRATNVALTILDEHTIVENNLVVLSADVKGSLTVEGDLVVKGVMPTDSPAFKSIVENAANSVLAGLDNTLFESYANIILEKINEHGIDLNKITIGGDDVIVDNRIGNRITESNLQKLGVVKDMRSSGETFLSESLYISNKRVGINTIDPGHALSIWDQDVEIVAGKKGQETALIGTMRGHELVITSNNKNNIVCRPDGSVKINTLVVGSTQMTSSPSMPTNDAPVGMIVWNTSPRIGSPIGWVSLGGARWATFGTINE